jgi:hypothetical protein
METRMTTTRDLRGILFVAGIALLAQSAHAQPGKQKAVTPSAASVESELIASERRVWEALSKKDYATFSSIVAADQIEVEPNGVYDKPGTLKGVRQVDLSGAALSNFKVFKISNDVVGVTYLVKGSPAVFGPDGNRSTTVYAKRGGKWLAVFHQGTPVGK